MRDDGGRRRPEEEWDRFIDALDLAGQRGTGYDTVVPSVGPGTMAGRTFGQLTRDEAKQLARIGDSLGRRGDTLLALWEDIQRHAKGPAKSPKRRAGRRK
jgi:hypothetical protein